jgi:hypothetical protein
MKETALLNNYAICSLQQLISTMHALHPLQSGVAGCWPPDVVLAAISITANDVVR